MGGESRYQFKIPSKQFTKKLFSTLNTKPETGINPWFLTGFADAEGCFSIKIQQNAKLKMKWRVRPVFSITLHIKDLALLESIKNNFFWWKWKYKQKWRQSGNVCSRFY